MTGKYRIQRKHYVIQMELKLFNIDQLYTVQIFM